jgi:hypothetical protein
MVWSVVAHSPAVDCRARKGSRAGGLRFGARKVEETDDRDWLPSRFREQIKELATTSRPCWRDGSSPPPPAIGWVDTWPEESFKTKK